MATKLEASLSCDKSWSRCKYKSRKFQFLKMFAFFRSILDWFKSLFWKEEMELTLVGLQYSGKTTFVNVIAVSSWKISQFFCGIFRFSLSCLCHASTLIAILSTCSLDNSVRTWSRQLGLIWGRFQREMSRLKWVDVMCFWFRNTQDLNIIIFLLTSRPL